MSVRMYGMLQDGALVAAAVGSASGGKGGEAQTPQAVGQVEGLYRQACTRVAGGQQCAGRQLRA